MYICMYVSYINEALERLGGLVDVLMYSIHSNEQ